MATQDPPPSGVPTPPPGYSNNPGRPPSVEEAAKDPELRKKILQLVEEKTKQVMITDLEAQDVDARLAIFKLAKSQDGKFWDRFAVEPTKEAIEEFIDGLIPDDASISATLSEARKQIESLYNLKGTWKALEKDYGTGVSKLDLINIKKLFANPEDAQYVVEQYISPTAKSALSASECNNTIIGATLGTVTKILADAVSNQVQAVFALSTSFSLLVSQVEGLGSALLNMPVQNLLSVLVSRDLIIDRVIKVARSLESIASDMSEKDYPYDHAYWLRIEQDKLKSAETSLGMIQATLEAGGKFRYDLWADAEREIDSAAEAFCGMNIDKILYGLSLRPLGLLGLSQYLKTLISVLKRQQQIRNLLINSIVTFNKEFFKLTRFDNLFVPIVKMIRCRLVDIDKQIDAAIKKNQFFYYTIKEKEWCIYLKGITALMRASSRMNLPETINRFMGTEILQKAAGDVIDTLNKATVESINNSFNTLVSLSEEMVSAAKRKSAVNVSPIYIQQLADAIAFEGELLKKADDPVSKILDFFGNLVPAEAFEAVLILNQLMSFAAENNLKKFAKELEKGNWEDALGFNGLVDNVVNDVVAQYVSQYIAASIAGGGITGPALVQLLAVKDAVVEIARPDLVKSQAINRSIATVESIRESIDAWAGINYDLLRIVEEEGLPESGPTFYDDR